jgi:two-component system CheB/CheR fusion protein
MVVAIGGSAGGLEAFRGLIAGLPPRSGIAYILVQHLDPDHPSLLADLLVDETPFPVVEVTNDMPLEPDRMHVIPSGTRMAVADGMLRLTPALLKQGPRLPFDFLLQSLAKEPNLRVVVVLLSGNGGDGSEGLRAARARAAAAAAGAARAPRARRGGCPPPAGWRGARGRAASGQSPAPCRS